MAVALYYLSRGSGPLQHGAHPQKRRPELLMVGPLIGDHLHQSGQRSYTVRELEQFIDLLVATR